MKQKLGLISVLIFWVSFATFVYWFFNVSGEEIFSGPVMIFLAIVLPAIGLITAFISKSKVFKIAGIVGNSFILLFSVVIPALSTLFWNQP